MTFPRKPFLTSWRTRALRSGAERVAAELAAMPSPSEALDAVLREAVLSGVPG